MKKLSLVVCCVIFLTCGSREIKDDRTTASVNVEDLYTQIGKGENVILNNCKITGEFDLLKCVTPIVLRQNETVSYISSALIFTNCVFEKRVSAFNNKNDTIGVVHFSKNITFIKCQFNETIDLSNSIIQGGCFFQECLFLRDFKFQNTQNNAEFEFVQCKVKGEALLHNSFFNRRASFFKTEFDSTCIFQSSIFNNTCDFNLTSFNAYTEFSLASFNSKAFFNYSKFNEKAFFNACLFKDRTIFNNSSFDFAEFKNSAFFLQNSFNEIIINTTLDFSNSNFILSKPTFDKVPIKNKIIGLGI